MTYAGMRPAHSQPGAIMTEPSGSVAWGPVGLAVAVLAWSVSPIAGFERSLMILTIAGFICVIVGLRYPAIGLLGITVLCILDAPARVYLFTGGLLRWNTLNYWLLLTMALYLPFLVRLRDPHSLSLVAFIALLVVELIISPDIANGTQHVLGISAVFGMLIYVVRAGQGRRMWFWISVNAGVVGALGGLMFFLARANLSYINENAWAASPLTALIVIVLGFPSAVEMRRGQPVLLMLAAANLMWIFLSGSRGTLLIGTCCFMVLLVSLRGVRQRTLAIAAGVLIAMAAASQFGKLQDRAIHRLTRLFTPEHALVGNYSLGSRTSGRSDLAIGGWYIFQQHPLGVGTGGFPTAWSNFGRHYGLVYGRGEEKAAHSGWVKTMVENGVPGLVLLLVYIFSFATAALRQRDRALWRLGMLTSVAVAAALLSTEFQTKGLWLLAAGATAFLQRDRVLVAMYRRDDEFERHPVARFPRLAGSHDS